MKESMQWDFIRQMKGILAIKNQLSLAEFKLLVTLFEVNNEQGRRETFRIDSGELAERAGMKRPNMLRARRPLVEKGLIQFELGNKKTVTVYRMKIMYPHDTEKGEKVYPHDTEKGEKVYPHDTEKGEKVYPHDTEKSCFLYPHDTDVYPHDTVLYPHDTEKVSEPLGDKDSETLKSIVKGNIKDICANDLFLTFWKAYPKKKAKKAAEKAFFKLNPNEELLDKMIDSLERQKKSREWQEDGGQYIPYPATWINGERWEDVGVEAGECDTTPTREERRREYEAELQRQAAYMDSLEV